MYVETTDTSTQAFIVVVVTDLLDSSFVSWWTFFFCGVFIVAFFWAAMSIISSIASHAVWIILT